MAKKDISTILNSGSPKQKALIIAEHVAREKYGFEGILTDNEFNRISDSFKKPNELKIWNKVKRNEATVSNAILNLQGLKFEVLMHYSNLRGYILVWNTVEHTELLSNLILSEINDPEERKRIAKKSSKKTHPIFTEANIDEEGFIDLSIDFESKTWIDENGKRISLKDEPRIIKDNTLWAVMNNVKKQAVESATKFISFREALMDYIEEEGFKVKTFTDIIDSMTEDVYRPLIGWPKYMEGVDSFHGGEIIELRLTGIKPQYNIAPNIYSLEVDPEIYNWFKTNLLTDE
jgi:hypothetical protein